MLDKEDYRKLLNDREKEVFKQNRPDLIQAIRSERAATKMLGDKNWDRFLEHIQGVVDQKQERLETVKRNLVDSSVVDHDEILKLKLELRELNSYIEALEFVMALPKELQDLGDEARNWFRRFSTKAGS